jgi:hypothetical protein
MSVYTNINNGNASMSLYQLFFLTCLGAQVLAVGGSITAVIVEL